MTVFRSLIFVSFLFLGSANTYALTKYQAVAAGTMVSAVTTGATTLGFRNYTSAYKKPALVALFALAEVAAVKFFLMYTPENRYLWAEKKLNSFLHDYIFMADIEQESLSAVLQQAGCEAYELPLVDAFLKLQYYDKQLDYMQQELQTALSDLDRADSLWCKINDLIEIIKPHLKRVRANEAFVKNQKNWLDQWKLYQERQLARERLQHYDRLQTHIIWNVRTY